MGLAWRFLPPNGRRMDRPPFASWILLALLAAAWTALGGAGHLFHANGIDWVPRFAVMRDLVVAPWPPRYGAGAEAMLLRAPPGAKAAAWADLCRARALAAPG